MQRNSIPGNMGLDHVGIVVPNVQAAADFLIETFAAEIDWEVKRPPTPTAGERGWSQLFGVHPAAYMPHVMMLKCGAQPLTQYIELFEWCAPDQTALPSEGWLRFSDIGNSYISITVKDIHAVMAHIKKFILPRWPGTRFIQDPPMQFPLRGEICTSTFLVSPWGMWIEITCWSKSKSLGKLIHAQYEENQAWIGQSIFNLPTPAFLIDLNIVDHNIKLLRERIVDTGIDWRIPSKAHRCPALAEYIMQQGHAQGVVLLTLDEAEYFAKAGIDDIYLANEVCKRDIERISLLAKRVKRLRVAIDNEAYLLELAKAILHWEILTPVEVLIELNIDHNRCGVNTTDDAVALAKLAHQIEINSGAIIFTGITGYEGHTPILPTAEKTAATAKSHHILLAAKQAIEASGIPVKVVSGGGSCNYIDCLNQHILTEIQAGGGAVGDLLYYHKANLKSYGHEMAAMILSEITSVPKEKNRAVGDAGFKTIGWHPFGGLPEIRDRKDLKVVGLSAEHVRIVPQEEHAEVGLAHGDKIILYPGYTDAMGFLHNKIFACRDDKIVAVWDTMP